MSVLGARLELAQGYPYRHLKPARLPIPPSQQEDLWTVFHGRSFLGLFLRGFLPFVLIPESSTNRSFAGVFEKSSSQKWPRTAVFGSGFMDGFMDGGTFLVPGLTNNVLLSLARKVRHA